MFRDKLLWLLFILSFVPTGTYCQSGPVLNIAIIGLGGRAQYLLCECLKLNQDIQVVAICDDNAHECIHYHREKIKRDDESLIPIYNNALANTAFYANTSGDLERLLKEEKSKIDVIFITSANYDHFDHLNTVLRLCSDKKIFMEKPLFRTRDEFEAFDFQQPKLNSIAIGLTLRYSSMACICAQQLKAHHKKLGALKKVKAWERLNFGHMFTAFIMDWRRYVDLSGGFLLEKSLHDLDLALYFIKELGIEPTAVNVSTETANKLYLKSRKNDLLQYMTSNDAFHDYVARSKDNPWKPFNFVRDEHGNFDWKRTLDHVFEEYPDNDDLTNKNLIPDYHKLFVELQQEADSPIQLELEVDACGFREKTVRGQQFNFENGEVSIDIMGSKMTIAYNDGTSHEYDLKTNNSDHADGDDFIVQMILGKDLPKGHSMSTLNDPIVFLASQIALISEEQAVRNEKKTFFHKIPSPAVLRG